MWRIYHGGFLTGYSAKIQKLYLFALTD